MTAQHDKTPEALRMTNEQSRRLELLARIDELDRLAETVTDRDTLERIKANKQALRADLNKHRETP